MAIRIQNDQPIQRINGAVALRERIGFASFGDLAGFAQPGQHFVVQVSLAADFEEVDPVGMKVVDADDPTFRSNRMWARK